MIVASLTACVHQNKLPEDFMFELSSTASQPGEPSSLMVIRKKQDNSGYEWVLQWENQSSRKDLADSTVVAIVHEIRKQKIFRLKKSYADFDVLDGGTQVLRIRINSREKVIQMTNHQPEEVRKVMRIVHDAGRSK